MESDSTKHQDATVSADENMKDGGSSVKAENQKSQSESTKDADFFETKKESKKDSEKEAETTKGILVEAALASPVEGFKVQGGDDGVTGQKPQKAKGKKNGRNGGKNKPSDVKHDLEGADNQEKPSKTSPNGKGASNGRHNTKKDKNNEKRTGIGKKHNWWPLQITIVSFFLTAIVSFLSDLAGAAHISVIILMLFLLILGSIVADVIGVAVTACELPPLTAMASKKVYGAKTAIKLVKNAEKVSNICNDVIGDIFGIVSGACSLLIVLQILQLSNDLNQQMLTILISSLVGALTIGGKAYMKRVAIKRSKDMVMFFAKIFAIFNPEEHRVKKKKQQGSDGMNGGSEKSKK